MTEKRLCFVCYNERDSDTNYDLNPKFINHFLNLKINTHDYKDPDYHFDFNINHQLQ